MTVTKNYLEKQVQELTEWLRSNTEFHPDFRTKKQQCNYYIEKLAEMDDFGTERTKINQHKN